MVIPQDYTLTQFRGAETASAFDNLAALRITVFRDFPYLYEGSVAYEKEYLRIYAQSEKSLLAAIYHGGDMVGATTCLPLIDETDDLIKPFQENGIEPAHIFYFGESIILNAHRGKGFGHLFFDVREAHAKSFGTFTHTCFCAVERATSHPRRPTDYRSNEVFWRKRGYQKRPRLQTQMEWLDVGESVPTFKRMTFWMREVD